MRGRLARPLRQDMTEEEQREALTRVCKTIAHGARFPAQVPPFRDVEDLLMLGAIGEAIYASVLRIRSREAEHPEWSAKMPLSDLRPRANEKLTAYLKRAIFTLSEWAA